MNTELLTALDIVASGTEYYFCIDKDMKNLDWIPDDFCPTSGCEKCGLAFEHIVWVKLDVPNVGIQFLRQGEDVDGFGPLANPMVRLLAARIVGVELECFNGHFQRFEKGNWNTDLIYNFVAAKDIVNSP
jgi:hypothetical protein